MSLLSTLRIGTRGSALALAQANMVKQLLHERCGISAELTIIKTTGDAIQDRQLAAIGGKGLFTKELETALLDGSIDLAVHSMKDVPYELPPGLCIAAMLEREDPRDVFVTVDKRPVSEISSTSTLRFGTGSARRIGQLLRAFPEASTIPLRGNVDTRLRKLEAGECSVLVLAAAGLHRLGFKHVITEYIDPNICLPSGGQGAVGLEIAENKHDIHTLLAPLNDHTTLQAVRGERAFLRGVGGDCHVPVAVFCQITGERATITARIFDTTGLRFVEASRQGLHNDTEKLGALIAEHLLDQGGRAILAMQKP